MHVGPYIYKRLIKTRTINDANNYLKAHFKHPHIITYMFDDVLKNVLPCNIDYRNRKMWVWFVGDIEYLKKNTTK